MILKIKTFVTFRLVSISIIKIIKQLLYFCTLLDTKVMIYNIILTTNVVMLMNDFPNEAIKPISY